MAVSTSVSGAWKRAEGTVDEVIGQLDSDDVSRMDLASFVQDGADNFVAVYYNA